MPLTFINESLSNFDQFAWLVGGGRVYASRLKILAFLEYGAYGRKEMKSCSKVKISMWTKWTRWWKALLKLVKAKTNSINYNIGPWHMNPRASNGFLVNWRWTKIIILFS